MFFNLLFLCFRDKCIFSIDPETAKDLDDALSFDELPDGNFEVGVHISDVAYYLEAGSPLDMTVAKRATSVYLVDSVLHMLPRLDISILIKSFPKKSYQKLCFWRPFQCSIIQILKI